MEAIGAEILQGIVDLASRERAYSLAVAAEALNSLRDLVENRLLLVHWDSILRPQGPHAGPPCAGRRSFRCSPSKGKI
jgi:hypothetical protein